MALKRQKIDILGVDVDDLDEDQVISRILVLAKDKKSSHVVVTVNTEFVMLARRDKDFARILQEADLALADGWWVVLAKQIFGGKAQSRITGVDLVERLCAKAVDRAVTIGFLGGFEGVAKTVSERQKAKNPGLKVVLAEPGDSTIGQDLRLRKDIFGKKRVDILFVAYGMGRQEFWIDRNKNHLNVGVFMGVGGAFDYISTVKRRAPRLMQKWGMEWFWRLLAEPTRIWRMRVLPVFLLLVSFKFLTNFLKNDKTLTS